MRCRQEKQPAHRRSGRNGNAPEKEDWLSDMDSNHDNSLQRAMCYRYTIGQTSAVKIPLPAPGAI